MQFRQESLFWMLKWFLKRLSIQWTISWLFIQVQFSRIWLPLMNENYSDCFRLRFFLCVHLRLFTLVIFFRVFFLPFMQRSQVRCLVLARRTFKKPHPCINWFPLPSLRCGYTEFICWNTKRIWLACLLVCQASPRNVQQYVMVLTKKSIRRSRSNRSHVNHVEKNLLNDPGLNMGSSVQPWKRIECRRSSGQKKQIRSSFMERLFWNYWNVLTVFSVHWIANVLHSFRFLIINRLVINPLVKISTTKV